MARSYKTEAVVLRSIRYAEADRVLHLYTAERGRVNAIGCWPIPGSSATG